MSTQHVAERLVELFNAGDRVAPYRELYDSNIISVEHSGGQFPRCVGIGEVMAKNNWWTDNFDVHTSVASAPLVADGYFSVLFSMDITHKLSGVRTQESEIAVYRVENKKIVYEEFFYLSAGEN